MQKAEYSHQSFAARLSECAHKIGGLGKLSAAAKIHRNTLTRYINGREPDRATIIAIAEASGVTPEWLMTGTQVTPDTESQPPGWLDSTMGEYKKRLSQILGDNGGNEAVAEITGFSPEHIARLRAETPLTDYEVATICRKLDVNADWLLFGRHEDQYAHGLSIEWPLGSKKEYKHRLLQIIDTAGGDRAVANITGFSEDRVNRLREGARLTDYEAAMLSQKLNVSLDWLLLGKQALHPASTKENTLDLTAIDELNIFYQGANLHCEIQSPRTFALSSSWVKNFLHCDPSKMAHFRMPNTEMEPVIREGASVVINRDDPLTTDGVYVFKSAEQFLVRKLEFIGPNAEVISPKTHPRRYQILDVRMNTNFHFFGKAVWWTASSA